MFWHLVVADKDNSGRQRQWECHGAPLVCGKKARARAQKARCELKTGHSILAEMELVSPANFLCVLIWDDSAMHELWDPKIVSLHQDKKVVDIFFTYYPLHLTVYKRSDTLERFSSEKLFLASRKKCTFWGRAMVFRISVALRVHVSDSGTVYVGGDLSGGWREAFIWRK